MQRAGRSGVQAFRRSGVQAFRCSGRVNPYKGDLISQHYTTWSWGHSEDPAQVGPGWGVNANPASAGRAQGGVAMLERVRLGFLGTGGIAGHHLKQLQEVEGVEI